MIHIGSDAGELGEVDIGVYSVSKAALHMLGKMLAVEGGRRGVRSNTIAPGDTEPGMRHMVTPGTSGRTDDDPAGWLVPPVGRLGRADDVAQAAVYLATDRAAFVNGVVLLVDGGARAGLGASTPPRH
jgi:NAD(P)-dependent dehydrogenase (short-subunit alcohol dehydrogenase family)